MKTETNGVSLAYDQQGTGPAVLFVHGYPLCRMMWQSQVKGLSKSASIYAVDLRGHGESSDSNDEFSMDLFADDLAAFIKATSGDKPVVLCGLSMGGYIAFAFIRKYPQLLSGLILTSTRAGADSPEGKAGRDKAIETVQKLGREEIFRTMLPKLIAPANLASQPGVVEITRSIMISAVNESTIVKDLKALRDRPDSTSLLPGIKVPTLIIHGADDQIIPVSEAQVIQAAIPGARLEVLQNAGHMLNLEQSDRFNAAVANFLEQFSKKQANLG